MVGKVFFDVCGVDDLFGVVVAFRWKLVINQKVRDVFIMGRLESCLHQTGTRRSSNDAVGRMSRPIATG